MSFQPDPVRRLRVAPGCCGVVPPVVVDEIGQIQERLRPTRPTQTLSRDVAGDAGTLAQMKRRRATLEQAAAEPVAVPVRHELEARLASPERLNGRREARRDHIDARESTRLQSEPAGRTPGS